MGAFVQFINEQELAIRACGRVCADMHPSTMPELPVPPPVSLLAILREHPEMVIEPEWLEVMDADPTLH